MTSRTLIQSFVRGRWFVSTAYRESSAMIDPAPWYFETIVWEWDAEKRVCGAMLDMHDSGCFDASAYENHARVCAELASECEGINDLCDMRDAFRAEDDERRAEG